MQQRCEGLLNVGTLARLPRPARLGHTQRFFCAREGAALPAYKAPLWAPELAQERDEVLSLRGLKRQPKLMTRAVFKPGGI